MVIYVAVKIVGAVKPWAGTDEYAASEPFRSIVAVGSATIGSVIIVAVRAVRGGAYADADADLGFCFRSGHREADSSDKSD
jgi:hypothetical protein